MTYYKENRNAERALHAIATYGSEAQEKATAACLSAARAHGYSLEAGDYGPDGLFPEIGHPRDCTGSPACGGACPRRGDPDFASRRPDDPRSLPIPSFPVEAVILTGLELACVCGHRARYLTGSALRASAGQTSWLLSAAAEKIWRRAYPDAYAQLPRLSRYTEVPTFTCPECAPRAVPEDGPLPILQAIDEETQREAARVALAELLP